MNEAITNGFLPTLLEDLRKENEELIVWIRGDHKACDVATAKNLIT